MSDITDTVWYLDGITSGCANTVRCISMLCRTRARSDRASFDHPKMNSFENSRIFKIVSVRKHHVTRKDTRKRE